jgi:hypothetical protein
MTPLGATRAVRRVRVYVDAEFADTGDTADLIVAQGAREILRLTLTAADGLTLADDLTRALTPPRRPALAPVAAHKVA